jgi:hypothetical protein
MQIVISTKSDNFNTKYPANVGDHFGAYCMSNIKNNTSRANNKVTLSTEYYIKTFKDVPSN